MNYETLEESINKLIDKYTKLKKERNFYKNQYLAMKENVENLLEKLALLEPLIIKKDNRDRNG